MFAIAATTFVVVLSVSTNPKESVRQPDAPTPAAIVSIRGDSGQMEAPDAVVGIPIADAPLAFSTTAAR